MEDNGHLISILASGFYLAASVRLLRLSRRTGERPELLLGIYFAFSGVYYLAYNLPSLFGFDAWSPGVQWIVEWAYILGVFPYLFFTHSVFRPGHIWATALVGFCSVLLLAGTAMGSLEGRTVYSLGNPWFVVQWVGYTVPCAWMCTEALIARRGARKRARIGLCAPSVANRYLLFALFGGFQTLACLADLSFAADIDHHQAASLVSNLLLGSSEIASVAVLWLAFFPPPFYTNWISRRAAIISAPMDE